MKNLLAILFMVTILGCGEIRGQYHRIVTPDEIQTTRFYCTTILTIPVFCGIYARTEITIRIRDIVIEVVRRIVEVERIVEVPIETIVNEVFIVHRDKEVDFESIILEVERRVRASIPHISLARVDVPVLIAEVSKAVLDGTPYTETGQVEHRVSKPKRRIPTPVTPPLQDNPTPVTPPPVENKDGGYIVYSHRVNGGIQSGVIHSDYAAIEDGKIFHTGQDGEIDAGDTSQDYIKIETGLTYEEASARAPEILTE